MRDTVHQSTKTRLPRNQEFRESSDLGRKPLSRLPFRCESRIHVQSVTFLNEACCNTAVEHWCLHSIYCVPGTLLNSLHRFSHWTHDNTFWGGYCHHSWHKESGRNAASSTSATENTGTARIHSDVHGSKLQTFPCTIFPPSLFLSSFVILLILSTGSGSLPTSH